MTVLLRLLAMLLPRDYLFDALASATSGVTTPLPRDHLFDSFATATGDVIPRDYLFDALATATGRVTTPSDIFYSYWQCYYA